MKRERREYQVTFIVRERGHDEVPLTAKHVREMILASWLDCEAEVLDCRVVGVKVRRVK